MLWINICVLCCLLFSTLAIATTDLFGVFHDNSLQYIDPKTGMRISVKRISHDLKCSLPMWNAKYDPVDRLIYTFHSIVSPFFPICIWSLQSRNGKLIATGKSVGDLKAALPSILGFLDFAISVHKGFAYLVAPFNGNEWRVQKFNIKQNSVQTLATFGFEYRRFIGSKTFVVVRPNAQFLLVDFHSEMGQTQLFWIDLNTGVLSNNYTFLEDQPHFVGVSGDRLYGLALYIDGSYNIMNQPLKGNQFGYLERLDQHPARHQRQPLRFQNADAKESGGDLVFSRAVFDLDIRLNQPDKDRLNISTQKHYGLGLITNGEVLNGTSIYQCFVDGNSNMFDSFDLTSGNLVGQVNLGDYRDSSNYIRDLLAVEH